MVVMEGVAELTGVKGVAVIDIIMRAGGSAGLKLISGGWWG